MSEDTVKPWKKTEDIPRRFDELPPEPGWVPVADVIRTTREDEAREEAQKEKFKIKPPLDSDSESSDNEVKQRSTGKQKKAQEHKVSEDRRKHTPSMDPDVTSVPPTVDGVTQSMVEWALSPDHYPRRKSKPTTHHKDLKPTPAKPKPSPLLGKSPAARDKASTKQASRPPKDVARSHISPSKDATPAMPSSPGGPKTQGNGGPRMRPKQLVGNQEQRPPYYEPPPDYDDDDYDACYSTYDRQYYQEEILDEELYYQQDQYVYEDRGAPDPYLYGSAPYEYAPYPHNHGYGNLANPHGDFGYKYEYGEPRYLDEASEAKYLHEAQSSGYPQPSPYDGPVPREYTNQYQQPRSSYDVLY